MPVAHLLSNWSEVGTCGLLMSLRAWQIQMISLSFMNPAPFSASCVDGMTASIILETTSITLLWGGGGELTRMGNVVFGLRDTMPPARDRVLDFYSYYVLDWIQRCIFWQNT